MWQRPAAVILFLLCTAGMLRPEGLSASVAQAIDEVFAKVDRLRPMPYGSTYTLTVGGKPVTAGPDYFLRRRTGSEILESGMSGGCGDNAIAALYLVRKRGLEAVFIDSVQISTQSLESGFSGHALIAVRDPATGEWVRIDPTRREYSWPWNIKDKSFYGNYWIGFRGRLADYPAHDPESLKKFYRDTLNTIPANVLNQTLFRFRFTVDPSLIAADGRYRNPNLDRLLRDNGKILAAHGVHPENEVAIRLTRGDDDADSRLERAEQGEWVCTVGLQSALSSGFVSYLEERLNLAREKKEPMGLVAGPLTSHRMLWAALGILCAAIVAVLFWQRRRLAGRKTGIGYWACQLLGWCGLITLSVAARGLELERTEIAIDLVFFVSGILLTDLLRRVIARRRWLVLPAGRMFRRLLLAVLSLATVQTLLIVGGLLAFHVFDKGPVEWPRAVLTMWTFSAEIMGLWVALYALITAPRRQREAQVQLQLALREAELRALEAQINPHFLFNCLNSIRALVIENPSMSQEMLTRLANILRYNLRHDVEHTVPLCSEVEIVGDYLALESARFEDRLRVKMCIDPNAGEVQVPPMLLQSLVENALKHGITPLPAGGDLLIRATVVGDSMLMEVENPGQLAGSASETTQLGVANVRERLRLLYDGRATFELKNRGGRVAAMVLIPRTA